MVWAVVLAVVLTVAAIALGSVWAMYRAYPYDHREAIEQNAALYGQDPLLIAAIIRTESHFNAEAHSVVGAVGLMQLMPDTAKWIAGKNGWDYDETMLIDGDTNIRLGCWYVNYLSERFDGDTDRYLSAYNAGESNVRQWVADGRFEGGRRDIPFDETRSFVQKVMNSYEKYKILYGEPKE